MRLPWLIALLVCLPRPALASDCPDPAPTAPSSQVRAGKVWIQGPVWFSPLDDPEVQAVTPGLYEPDAPSMAVTVGDETRIYPIRALTWHHVVNDTLGGKSVAVTFCAVCNSGAVYEADLPGTGRLTFRQEGIYNGAFVMRDRETKTLWMHYTGEAFRGRHEGRSLTWMPSERGPWSRLVARHPTATTPKPEQLRFHDTMTAAERLQKADRGGMPPGFEGTMLKGDKRLARREHGLGVAAGGDHRYYRLTELRERAVIHDEVGGIGVVVLIQDAGEVAAAYARCVDGRELTFTATTHEGRIALRDTDTGTLWTTDGAAVEGPLSERQLVPVRSIVSDWYGWSGHFPQTDIYGE